PRSPPILALLRRVRRARIITPPTKANTTRPSFSTVLPPCCRCDVRHRQSTPRCAKTRRGKSGSNAPNPVLVQNPTIRKYGRNRPPPSGMQSTRSSTKRLLAQVSHAGTRLWEGGWCRRKLYLPITSRQGPSRGLTKHGGEGVG